jgi:hypothetical protein
MFYSSFFFVLRVLSDWIVLIWTCRRLIKWFFQTRRRFRFERNITKTFLSWKNLICITLTKRSLEIDVALANFWLRFRLFVIDDKAKKRLMISLRFRFMKIDFVNAMLTITCVFVDWWFAKLTNVFASFVRRLLVDFSLLFLEISMCNIDLFF